MQNYFGECKACGHTWEFEAEAGASIEDCEICPRCGVVYPLDIMIVETDSAENN